ncbi:Histidinol dehydrogenase [Buchnera aphidicola (Cinara kochiana kochiana)]|uniref:Histidinol dehydrogenase n=1 Tax=Buchnera aphidicola (Cinara kochiana kochiana) TaxID=2518976 RepID=A0A451D571_9GAMM|nr:histidinol dehydrogenase [Buchnera aphidicola]VFP80989.1 Histidinol dehydrogenase [Buchnera aphidicola (Cinara kochiana kochiana)]
MLNLNKNIFYWNRLTKEEKNNILLRPRFNINNSIKSSVSKIIDKVKQYGDVALHTYNLKFDKIKLDSFYVTQEKIDLSANLVSETFKKSVSIAKKNIISFHTKQIAYGLEVETYPGVRCQQIIRPIHAVGLYIPKGKYPLVSTALMLSIPAKLAGCTNICLCSPPPVSNEILYIAKVSGIKQVIQLGGAQGIAALALGTQSIQRVDKIFGPGNIFVTEAKLQISQSVPRVSIDMPAGPSEMLIIADKDSNPNFVAADFLAQLEHDNNSQVILLSTSIGLLKNVIAAINRQILFLTKKDIILCSLKNSRIIITQSLLDCFNISNLYSPEHLTLHIKNSVNFLSYIKNAGSVFLGKWTPGSAGDYITGANHVLPTYGYSNTYSSLQISDFQKIITVQKMTKQSLINLSDSIIELSQIEGMDAHGKSIIIRTNALKDMSIARETI